MKQSTPDAAEVNAGLCFRDAIDAIEGGMISREEYFEHLIAHYRGSRHPFNHEPGIVYQLIVTEPVASSIRQHSLKNDYNDFNPAEIEACRKLFHSCVEGNMATSPQHLKNSHDDATSSSSLLLSWPLPRDKSRYFDCASPRL
jgi:hypothetical protein